MDEFDDLVEFDLNDLNDWIDKQIRAGDENLSQPAEEVMIG